MKENKIQYLILYTLLLTAFSSFATPILEVEKDIVLFEDLTINQVKIKKINLKNTGTSTLKVKRIHSSCKCLYANLDFNKIEPSQSETLTIKIDTKNLSGEKKFFLILRTNDPKARFFKISCPVNIQTTTDPFITVFPEKLIFKTLKNDHAKATLLVKNIGKKILHASFSQFPEELQISEKSFSILENQKKILKLNLNIKKHPAQFDLILKSNSINAKQIKIPVKIEKGESSVT